ncbi:MAG: heme-binding domain-containing protein [Ferruginibacter sp.]|nr:heme-binding domain-containing protein [Ferruginibacter sp.]
MRKTFKRILLIIVLALALIQFFPRAEKNQNAEIGPDHIASMEAIPTEVSAILEKACYDCHSNNTIYPWYNNIQPVNWWLNKHIIEGSDELNFSEFGSYSAKRQNRKWKEVVDELKENNMPLKSYTFLHPKAKLTATEKEKLISWASSHIIRN